MYVLYKPANEKVLKRYHPRAKGPSAYLFKTSSLAGLYNACRPLNQDIYYTHNHGHMHISKILHIRKISHIHTNSI